jgi:integral membrane sensor domain MASE1
MSIIGWLSVLSILLPLAAGALKFKSLSFEFKCFFYYVLLGIVCECLSYYLRFHENSLQHLLSIYFLIEAEFLIFFIVINSMGKQHLSLAVAFCLTFLILWIYLLNYYQTIDESTSIFKSITALFISCFTGYGLYKLTSDSESNLFKNPLFWIQVGILVYFFGTLFVFYTIDWQDSKGENIVNNTVYVHDYLNIIYNLCQATAFWLFRKVKTSTF